MSNDYNEYAGNNRLYKISQNISWFFIITLWFNLSFIPLFFFFLFLEPTLANIVWYLVGIIPLGPAIGALISSTIRVIEEDDFSEPGKDFRRYYKKNFLDSLKVWLPYLVIVYLFSVNINYYFTLAESQYILLGYLFFLLTALVTLYLIPVFIIQMKFSFRYKDLLKLSAYYFFTKMKLTIGNFFVIFIVIFLLLTISEWLLLAIPAVLSFLWILYNFSIVKDVKANFVKEEE
ncbi:YesL family protein [Alkalibacterium sp. MB6]|uniref:YesL family protein n=1 Tax=Alkalibacterium sp. MB6 TaxID=2081965 RepID=UPI00137B4E9F|nr:YesL family protein [Alkalibacterium sp. MB6]